MAYIWRNESPKKRPHENTSYTYPLSFLPFFRTAFSQSFDYVTSFGFNTIPDQLVPLTGGRWLAVCTGIPIPGASNLDTVAAVIFDSNGEVLIEKRLELPSSPVHRVKSAVGTPDGGFAISVALDICDVWSSEICISVFDNELKLKWQIQEKGLPFVLKTSSDGNLMGVYEYGYGLVNFNLTNGEILSSFKFQDPDTYFRINDFDIVNGKLLAIGSPDLQLWEKSDSIYYLYDSKNIFSVGSPDKIARDSTGNYYFFNRYDKNLYRFDPYSLDFTLLGTYPFNVIDFIATASNIVMLAENETPYNFLVNVDFQGNMTDTIRTFPGLLKATMLSYKDNTLSVAGIHGSGPSSAVIDAPWLPFNAHQLWLHTNHLDAEPSPLPANAALTNVIQTTPIVTDSVFSDETGKYQYYVSGGQYQVEVTNAGETLLESIDIHIGFLWNRDWICFYRPVQKAHYSGLGLLPGESVVLEFGDIQGYMPSRDACFWTSAPNHKPDAAPENDIFCKSTIAVAINEPSKTAFTLTPNPADESIHISFSESSDGGYWKLFDITGRQLKAGQIASGVSALDITTADLVRGMYLCQINNNCVKVLIEHK